MAPAIDHGSGAARRPTDRARSARAIGTRAGGCRATGAGDSAVGRRPQLRHDRDDDGLQFADDRVVETPVRAGRPAGMGGPASRLETDGADARPGCAQHDLDPSATAARRDPVARAWQQAGLQPPRLERYMRSTDPECETKAADVIGLYRDPPQHAAVFCVDEKTAIQALDRLDPVLPLSPGRAERHGVEYDRHGTLSLYAALNTRTGDVVGHTAARHTSAEFVSFLQAVVDTQPSSARAAHHRGQSLGPQNAAGSHLLGRASAGPSSFHADVFVLAQPSRTLVLEDRTRCHGAGPLHLRHRPAPQADALYQALQQDRDTHPLGGCRPLAEDRVTAVQLVRTVH